MGKINLKANKGVTMTDVIVALVILSIFAGVIGEMYYLIMQNNIKIRMNAMAVYYAVQIAEDIDKMPYEDVTTAKLTQKLNDTENGYNCPDELTVTITVSDYKDTNEAEEDVVKKVNIKVDYKALGEDQTYEIRKNKIKEI